MKYRLSLIIVTTLVIALTFWRIRPVQANITNAFCPLQIPDICGIDPAFPGSAYVARCPDPLPPPAQPCPGNECAGCAGRLSRAERVCVAGSALTCITNGQTVTCGILYKDICVYHAAEGGFPAICHCPFAVTGPNGMPVPPPTATPSGECELYVCTGDKL
jgi:hypothetical protein